MAIHTHKFKSSNAALGFVRGIDYVNDSSVKSNSPVFNENDTYPYLVEIDDDFLAEDEETTHDL